MTVPLKTQAILHALIYYLQVNHLIPKQIYG